MIKIKPALFKRFFSLEINFTTLAVGCFLGLFTYVFIRTGWVAEDAFITFRVIDHLLSGHGLVWNPGERVQVFTHPLWLAALSPLVALNGDPYWSSLLLSYACSIAAFLVLLRIPQQINFPYIGILSLLFFSRAFIEYSSAGLENSLSHLIVAVICLLYLRPEIDLSYQLLMGFIGLSYLVRPDLPVLFIPMVVTLLWSRRKQGFSSLFKLLCGLVFVPISWSIFSLFYFGSLVPNTALAKVGTGMGAVEKLTQFQAYMSWIYRHDPGSVGLLLCACITGMAGFPRLNVMLAAFFLWFFYLLMVGTDYMGGRFLTPLLVISVVCLVRAVELEAFPGKAVTFLLAMGASSLSHTFFLHLRAPEVVIESSGIADERSFYARDLSIESNVVLRNARYMHPWFRLGQAQRHEKDATYIACVVGMFGYGLHNAGEIIDPFAITDPFLARLPARPGARIGHYERAFPEGYLETRVSGRNQLSDPKLHELWDLVDEVAKGPLFSRHRLEAIWRLNTAGRELVAQSNYNPSKVGLPGIPVISNNKLSCLGRNDLLPFWQVVMTGGVVKPIKLN